MKTADEELRALVRAWPYIPESDRGKIVMAALLALPVSGHAPWYMRIYGMVKKWAKMGR